MSDASDSKSRTLVPGDGSGRIRRRGCVESERRDGLTMKLDPLPIDRIFRMANRLSINTLLVVIVYAAILLSLLPYLGWGTFVLAVAAAFGIYHANLRIQAAAYYQRPVAYHWHYLWPLYSAFWGLFLAAMGIFGVFLGAVVGFFAAVFLSMPFYSQDDSLVIGVFLGILPGLCAGVILGSNVVTYFGKHLLKLE